MNKIIITFVVMLMFILTACNTVDKNQVTHDNNKVLTKQAATDLILTPTPTATPMPIAMQLNQEFIDNNIVADKENQTVTIKYDSGDITFKNTEFIKFNYVDRIFKVMSHENRLEYSINAEDYLLDRIVEKDDQFQHYYTESDLKRRVYNKENHMLMRGYEITLESEGQIIRIYDDFMIECVRDDGITTKYYNAEVYFDDDIGAMYLARSFNNIGYLDDIIDDSSFEKDDFPYVDANTFIQYSANREEINIANIKSFYNWVYAEENAIKRVETARKIMTLLNNNYTSSIGTEYESNRYPYEKTYNRDSKIRIFMENTLDQLAVRMKIEEIKDNIYIAHFTGKDIEELYSQHYDIIKIGEISLLEFYLSHKNDMNPMKYGANQISLEKTITIDGITIFPNNYENYIHDICKSIEIYKNYDNNGEILNQTISEANFEKYDIKWPELSDYATE